MFRLRIPRFPTRLNLVETKRVVALVVHPRPNVRNFQSRACARRRRSSIYCRQPQVVRPLHAQRIRPSRDSSPSHGQTATSDLAFADLQPVPNSVEFSHRSLAPESGTATSSTGATSSDNLSLSRSCSLGWPRTLRSSRSRKCRSIDEMYSRLSEIKEASGPERHTWPNIGGANVTTFSFTSSSLSIHSGDRTQERRDQSMVDDTCAPPFSLHSCVALSEAAIGESTRATGDTEYITAPSHFDPSIPSSDNPSPLASTSILQAIDRSSGAVFEGIHQGGQGEVGARIVARLVGFADYVSIHSMPVQLHSDDVCAPTIKSDDSSLARPTLMLTIPTPTLPHSPLFVPQSPITVSKFFSATALATPRPDDKAIHSAALDPSEPLVPSLAPCGRCGLPEFDEGTQCRLCNERWLACKVWYRANDGGRRRWLTEPYIRPAECNETNRAIMRGLGVAGLNSTLCSLDDAYQNSSRRKSYLSDFSGVKSRRGSDNRARLMQSLRGLSIRRITKRLSRLGDVVSRFNSRRKNSF